MKRSVIVVGHGVRASGMDVSQILEAGIPILSSWQAADVIDNFHPMYFGRPGIYGQRCANKILYEADHIISIGSRMCAWMIGHQGLRPDQTLVMFDIDKQEVDRFPNAQPILMDLKDLKGLGSMGENNKEWVEQCNKWREEFPLVEAGTHDDTKYMNSYRIMAWVNNLLRPDEVMVLDNGSIVCPVFQAMKFKPPQRVMTSGCLGEMGCALPGAIGASFARGKGEVLAVIGDGGMMMNIQELATIKHHNLPIKMMVFENDGYAMIKGTYKNVQKERVGVDRNSGLSFPDFSAVSAAFGIETCHVSSWEELIHWVPVMLSHKGPFLMQLHIDPEQEYVPRLKPKMVRIPSHDGKTMIVPARFDQLSP